MNKVWTEAEIVLMLMNNDAAVDKAVLAIYNRQTESEKATQHTQDLNGMGFNGYDARTGSYYAKWILSGRNLSGKHLANARKMMIKYRRQLVEIANKGNEIVPTADDNCDIGAGI